MCEILRLFKEQTQGRDFKKILILCVQKILITIELYVFKLSLSLNSKTSQKTTKAELIVSVFDVNSDQYIGKPIYVLHIWKNACRLTPNYFISIQTPTFEKCYAL